jgi:hypothetical protein
MAMNWESDRWYIPLTAAGGAIATAAVAVLGDSQYGRAVFLIGFGLALVGAGEWQQHQRQEYLLPGGKAVAFPRRWRPLGVLLDACGIAALARGAYLIW